MINIEVSTLRLRAGLRGLRGLQVPGLSQLDHTRAVSLFC